MIVDHRKEYHHLIELLVLVLVIVFIAGTWRLTAHHAG